MPVEFELKYILDVEPETYKRQLEDLKVKEIIDIQQGYMTKEARMRHCVFLSKNEEVFIFSFKKRIQNYHLEIETPISREDFEMGWNSIDKKLSKVRYKIKDDGNIWEIDFFYENDINNVYFVMAEIELPLESPVPSSIPDFISDNLLFVPDENDHRFKNGNMTNPEEVRILFNGLKRDKMV
jgi:CYTH domain-containing protein